MPQTIGLIQVCTLNLKICFTSIVIQVKFRYMIRCVIQAVSECQDPFDALECEPFDIFIRCLYSFVKAAWQHVIPSHSVLQSELHMQRLKVMVRAISLQSGIALETAFIMIYYADFPTSRSSDFSSIQ
ncbi:unnamed protein product [Lactuca saligna]|uniref:Uncharacterized protein n=1 Tax=Lactuca saligna TaxID=75948 RepID=A0AA35Y409_LACSI|nr:unnamed protein product [Lactuca saligna]